MQSFSENEKVGALELEELEKGLKWWVSGANKWPEKRGLRAAHPRTTFQYEPPPQKKKPIYFLYWIPMFMQFNSRPMHLNFVYQMKTVNVD